MKVVLLHESSNGREQYRGGVPPVVEVPEPPLVEELSVKFHRIVYPSTGGVSTGGGYSFSEGLGSSSTTMLRSLPTINRSLFLRLSIQFSLGSETGWTYMCVPSLLYLLRKLPMTRDPVRYPRSSFSTSERG